MNKRSMGLKQYFKKNHYGYITVNIDIARYKISKTFDKWYKTEKMKISEIIPELKKNLDSLKFLHKQYKKEENDNRSGEETYGFKTWESDLTYISDRWQCQFRTRWLIDLIENEYYKTKDLKE
jgi:hypothetical protein